MTTVTAAAETTTLLRSTAAAPGVETTMFLGTTVTATAPRIETTTLFPANVTTTSPYVLDLVSFITASKPMPTITSSTKITTTTTANSDEDDIYLKKTIVVEETAVLHTKIIIIVVICVVVGLGCVLVVFAYLKYLNKKTRVVLPTIVYRPNEPVVIPEFRQTPVMSHRNRMTDLGRYFLPSTISRNFAQLQQQQPKQLFEIEIQDIKFFVPDFEQFPGFDLEHFRHIASGVRNVRLLTEPGYKLECDPLRVFHFFPETNCLD
jgi:uncharacterized protein (UPF0333 family)